MVTHERNNKIKNSKIDMLAQEFESIRLMPNELINNFLNRFKGISNNLQSFEKVITCFEMNKVLRSLPGEYNSIINPIEIYKDINTMSFQELMGKSPGERKGRVLKKLQNSISESDDNGKKSELYRKFKLLNNKIKKLGSSFKDLKSSIIDDLGAIKLNFKSLFNQLGFEYKKKTKFVRESSSSSSEEEASEDINSNSSNSGA